MEDPTMKTLATLAVFAMALPSAHASDRILRAEIEVPAPVAEVWKAWATEEGVKSFFAPGAHIEAKVDGLYEIYFNPAAAPGDRGADGMRILAFEPEKRLAFTWNAPPTIPAIRGQRTMVVVQMWPVGEKRTGLRFTHQGWGEGPEWDQAYTYFDKAWNAVVLPRLVQRFTTGPVDWSAKPELKPVAASLQQTLR
jgi:uncharacterized protein YndB with AHSA1/START domain